MGQDAIAAEAKTSEVDDIFEQGVGGTWRVRSGNLDVDVRGGSDAVGTEHGNLERSQGLQGDIDFEASEVVGERAGVVAAETGNRVLGGKLEGAGRRAGEAKAAVRP